MSALIRHACPFCDQEVLILRGAANRRWICCHCQGIIDLDALEGVAADGPVDPGNFEWEPLPTAHAAPRAAPRPRVFPLAEPVPRTDRERAFDMIRRRDALIVAEKQSRLTTLVTGAFIVLACILFFYPSEVKEDSYLPELNIYFQSVPMLFPYILGSLRFALVLCLLISANALYYGKPWAPSLGAGVLVVVCLAFNFHPAPVVLALLFMVPLWFLRRWGRYKTL